MKKRVSKMILVRDLFWKGFLVGFLLKICVLDRAGKAIIYYKNSDSSVYSVIASKTAPGPPRDQFWLPDRAPLWV